MLCVISPDDDDGDGDGDELLLASAGVIKGNQCVCGNYQTFLTGLPYLSCFLFTFCTRRRRGETTDALSNIFHVTSIRQSRKQATSVRLSRLQTTTTSPFNHISSHPQLLNPLPLSILTKLM